MSRRPHIPESRPDPACRTRTRTVRVLVCMLGVAFTAQAGASEARRRMAEGHRAYARGDWAQAADAFGQAAREAPAAGLDPAPAWHNAALALARTGAVSEALDSLHRAEQTLAPHTRARALFNRGRALAEAAHADIEDGNVRDARQKLESARMAYRQAIEMDRSDREAKVGYEIVQRRWQDIEQEIESTRDPEAGRNGEPDPETALAPDEQPGEGEPDPARPEPEPGETPPGEGTPDSEGEVAGESYGEPGESPPGADGAPSSEMTPEEAGRILDALRTQEAAQRATRRRPAPQDRVEKDW